MTSNHRRHQAPTARKHERGATLILVTVLLVIMLVGGLALVALTSGEVTGSRGFRTKESTEACADAGLQKMRSLLPDSNASAGVSSSVAVPGGNTLTFRSGHYTGGAATTSGVEVLDQTTFDSSGLYDGQRITNQVTGSTTAGYGVRMLAMHATCGGAGSGETETEMVFRYGIPGQ
jgi:hypothetical protein